MVDDASITLLMMSKLSWSCHADGVASKVETTRGMVELSGTADSNEAKDCVGRLARNTPGVRSVDNQIVVVAGKPGAVKGNSTEVSDGWITTKVKSTFLYSRNVDNADITVSTSNGVVTLTGKVDNAAERDLANELARNVRGVKSVNSDITEVSALSRCRAP